MHNSDSVLVIGTHPQLAGLRHVLEFAGHEVVAARSGRDGLRKLLHGDYDLLAIDAEMDRVAVEILQKYCAAQCPPITLVRISGKPTEPVETLVCGRISPSTTKYFFDSIRYLYFTPRQVWPRRFSLPGTQVFSRRAALFSGSACPLRD